jgi:tetratricopeptide (TPR) repeat protein
LLLQHVDDRAIADFDEALRLDPGSANARLFRGLTWIDRGRLDRALADVDEAVRLEPRNDDAHYARAVLRFAMRRDGAADDARAAREGQGPSGSNSTYAALLGYFALLRDGHKERARALLDEAAAGCDATAWPYPVLKHLRGELDEPGLLAAAESESRQVEARCYLGLEALEKGNEDAAIAHFRWVKVRGNPRWTQYTISAAELDRLLAKGAEGDGL